MPRPYTQKFRFGRTEESCLPGTALHRGKGPNLARAESFHPDEQMDLTGPEFYHSPLSSPYDNFFGEALHRTVLTFTLHNTFPHLKRSLSCDHAHGNRRKDRSAGFYESTFSPLHFEDRAPSAAAEKKEERSRDTNVSGKSSRLDTLCDKCKGINILTLTADGGYVHSTLDVLEEKALTCRLCKVLFGEQGTSDEQTLDRYQIVLSLLENLQDPPSDHPIYAHSDVNPRRDLWIDTVDTRPHEFPEGKRGRMHTMDGYKWPSQNPSMTGETIVRVRSLVCYTEENDPSRKNGMPWLRNIGTNTASARSLNTAKGWLERCLQAESHKTSGSAYNHSARPFRSRLETISSSCPKGRSRKMPQPEQEDLPQKFPTEGPTRLLFIANPDDIENSNVHLVETNGALFPYATLSYCWGKLGTGWLCTKHNLNQYLHHIDRRSLPATIRDSIVIAATLGIHYIWIDALCIIQDSSSDWAMESAKMGSIYHGSLVTIAAAGSSDSEGGCFNKISRPRFIDEIQNPDSRLQRTTHRNNSTSFGPFNIGRSSVCVESILQNGAKSRLHIFPGVRISFSDDLYSEEALGSPLSERAWVLQEQVLSRRTIYFTQSQLFWECEHCRLSEDNWRPYPKDHTYDIMAYAQPLSRNDIVEKWYQGIVQSYSARSLTQKTDKLIAISAVARAIYLNRHVDYLAGLWKDCILEGLVWRRCSSGRKSRTYPCPSWSWASQESSVTYDRVQTYLDGQSKLIDAHVEIEPDAPFGNVKNGHIKLDTRVTSGWVMRRLWRYGEFRQDLIFSNTSGTMICDATVIMDDEDYAGHEVTIAYIGGERNGLAALLLEPVLGKSQTYRRVGLLVSDKFADLDRKEEKRAKSVSWTRKTIVIQ